MFVATNHQYMMFFYQKRMFLDACLWNTRRSKTAKGRAIQNLINMRAMIKWKHLFVQDLKTRLYKKS
jgi:DNA gyrase subunit A